MKLWLISQTENRDCDTYDSAVVAAETEEQAKLVHPAEGGDYPSSWREQEVWSTWCKSPDAVTAKLIGEATTGIPKGVVLASFNAG